jgi:SAM-dependent methyltransferase
MNCRNCATYLALDFIDLGTSPYSNAFLSHEELVRPELWSPLRVAVCSNCWLVQTREIISSEELFTNDYVYFSGYSSTWLNHSQSYANTLVEKLKAKRSDFFIEIASNDGTLIAEVAKKGLRVLGIEPTESTANKSRGLGIETLSIFLGKKTGAEIAMKYGTANFIAANNVLAHVPDINDFVSGIKELLSKDGTATIEFPHFLNLLVNKQFDTIYHEHFSYLSLLSVEKIINSHQLSVFDVEELPTHGGSLRIFIEHTSRSTPVSTSVLSLREKEFRAGLAKADTYTSFADEIKKIKVQSLTFLVSEKLKGKKIVGYGAAAKGNTFLNYLGLNSDVISYVVDANPNKQGLFLPGSRIPVVSEDSLIRDQPDYVVIFPWNLMSEISNQLNYISKWGGKFVVFIPDLLIF